ncbi:hypothetical protein GCM10007874_37350 [Labrys miyagiensis]|uniref:DUF5680 domain-containing protein n=1 Tax=Labrys miyagiensis TaxID=346912 RepID=A0ABQ6CK55_9HYPH|nr:DUF5680 domain-containing protein [Labrys miyagiensis]GLS20718.1 hypothetical protein GCM10007874_37350 [Labrys miyagiensis]
MSTLENFIVEAKAAAYVNDGAPQASCRAGSHDIGYGRGDWRYLDSYFGGTDFLGQEIVWREEQPIWAMNYYGHILEPVLIDAGGAGAVVKKARAALYREGRFLGDFSLGVGKRRFESASTGDIKRFLGVERIFIGGVEAYRLQFHGGLIRP